ncbi:hypothetical protein WCD74_01285 [Actinomycetospora sp. OC33-EN08]|uniref:Protein kinase domain-containing protein n=1 Tax=Actinomycetospora aurantiaca TaxID=3129233 RepID=A0ABU8MIA4_9PSEU
MTNGTGHVLGDRYRLARQLDGTADRPVWVALDEWSDDDEEVLLALVPGSVGATEEAAAIRRVVGREVRVATGLRSQHVRRVLDVVSDGSGLWVASRTRAGSRTLQEVFDEGPSPDPARLARWGRDVAAGLADMHEAGLEHRAVGAPLIAIDDDGSASLLGAAAGGDRARPGDPDDGDTLGADDVRALGKLLGDTLETRDRSDGASEDRRVEALAALLSRAADGDVRADDLRRRLAETLESQPTSMPAATPAAPAGPGAARTVRLDPAEDIPRDAERPTTRVAPAPAGAPRDLPPWNAAGPGPHSGGPYREAAQPPHGRPGTPPPLPPRSLPHPPPVPGTPPGGQRTVRTPTTRGRDWVTRHRGLVTATAIVVALLVIAGLFVAGVSGMGPQRNDGAGAPTTPTSSVAPAPTATTAASAIGDRRSANPCSLLSASSFAAFGSPILFDDFGPFGSCAVLTGTAQGGSYLTSASFFAAGEFTTTRPTEQVGDVAVTRFAATAVDRCRRLLVLPDETAVEVETRAITAAPGVDPCALADAGTSTAVPVLAGRSTARRALDPSLQLSSLNACAVLDSPALAQVPGIDPTRRIEWFEGWGCSIGYNLALTNAPYVNVSFTRTSPFTGNPTRIGRHSAVLTPTPAAGGRSAACQVNLIQRSYVGGSGRARAEVVQLTVYGSTGDPCATATPVAAATEARLPAPS